MNNQFKLLICGSRTFDDYELLKREARFYILSYCCVHDFDCTEGDEIIIISGTAIGADQLGEKYAHEIGYKIEQYPAQWEKYGKRAGYIRNETMVSKADAVICFWDQKSKGTLHTINLCERYGKQVHVVKFKLKNNIQEKIKQRYREYVKK